MRKLVMHQKGEAPRDVLLDRERITIGRHPANDIALEDKAVSGKHAAVITIGQNSYLQDLGSTNGTLVNGSPVSKHTLRNGDVILIGATHFGFQEVADKPAEAGKPPQPDFAFLPLSAPRPVHRPPQAQGPDPGVATALGQAITNAPAVDIVDQMISAIKSHKTTSDLTLGARAQKIRQEWVRVMDYADKLKTRIGNNPEVKYFSVSRKTNDVMIRVPGMAGKGEKLYLLAPRHPDGKHGDAAIWLRITGENDQHFDQADDVIKELINSLSHLF